MIGIIICALLGSFFLIMTAICLNVDWNMISGVNMLPKEERQKFKEKHDMRAMNRYIGKRIFFPLAVLCSILAPILLLEFELMQSTVVGIVFFVAVVAFIVYIVSTASKVLGNKFEK